MGDIAPLLNATIHYATSEAKALVRQTLIKNLPGDPLARLQTAAISARSQQGDC